MENVLPELDYTMNSDLIFAGEIIAQGFQLKKRESQFFLGLMTARNPNNRQCFDSSGKDNAQIQIFPCHGMLGNQYFEYTNIKDIRFEIILMEN